MIIHEQIPCRTRQRISKWLNQFHYRETLLPLRTSTDLKGEYNMSKRLFLAASILSIGGVLAACGTEEPAQEDPATTAEDTFEEAVDEAGDEDVPAADATEDEDEETEETDNGTATDPVVSEGTLTASDEQQFELYVLPGYALTAEEPNKDSLYLEEDDSVFMRIESFSLEESDFDTAESVTIQTLEAVNPDAEVSEARELDQPQFVQSSVYSVPSAEGTVTGITVETDEMIVRFSIFDNASVNATEDFIYMGETIRYTGN